MKRSKPHNVYLSRQAIDIMIALKTCAGNSRYLLPSRYDADAPMSRATFNRVTYAVVEQAKKEGLPLEPFTVQDERYFAQPGEEPIEPLITATTNIKQKEEPHAWTYT